MGNVLAVFALEWKRSLTVPRMAWWLLLAAFPVFIVGMIRFIAPKDLYEGPQHREFRLMLILVQFALVPMLVTMLGTLLWATPVISAEIERRSWVFLTIRPNGSTAVLLGKYLAAVTWVIPPVLVGLSIAVPLSGVEDAWLVWWTLGRLVCLSCPAYGAVYLLLGTILPRRAMVLAVGYTLIFELVISFVPAVINKVTVQYRLRALLFDWCQLFGEGTRPSGAMALVGDSPAWEHVVVLLLIPPALLALSVFILRQSEFSTSAESDV